MWPWDCNLHLMYSINTSTLRPRFMNLSYSYIITSFHPWKASITTQSPIYFNHYWQETWSQWDLQEQFKKAFCYQKLFWPFTIWINCYSDLKNFANSRPSSSNFKSFSPSPLWQFFLTVDQNNVGNKIPFRSCNVFF